MARCALTAGSLIQKLGFAEYIEGTRTVAHFPGMVNDNSTSTIHRYMGSKVYHYHVKNIERVLDGDTLEATLSIGFNISFFVQVRLNGIDAPENHTTTKDASAIVIAAIKKWISQRTTGIGLSSYEWDKYGRVLGDLYATSEDAIATASQQTLCEYLLANKLVRPYKGDKKVDWTPEQLAVIRAFKA